MSDDIARRCAAQRGKIGMALAGDGTNELFNEEEIWSAINALVDLERIKFAPLLAACDAVLAVDWDDITEEPAVLTDKYIGAMNALRAARGDVKT